MKKRKITYGVSGMMEFQAVIKVGRNKMKVLFTDGSMNAMGVNPARFTTSSYMVQHAIENSPEYKRGLIKRVSVTDLDGEVEIERHIKRAEDGQKTEVTEVAPVDIQGEDCAVMAEVQEEDCAVMAEVQEEDCAVMAEVQEEDCAVMAEVQQDTADAKAELPRVEVEFAVNDDAKDYLEQNYGADRCKLRKRADILAYAEAHNVDIKFV